MGLRELRIADLAVIAEARLEPGEGFTALTGETGAGKSVCVNALRAALGLRLDGESVRPGAASTRVAAVFDSISPQVQARLATLGIPEDELLTLSRDVVRGGRATSRINGALVSQAVLREVGEALVEVTAQGASQRLLGRRAQRDLLDAAADASHALCGQVEAAVREWREAAAALLGAEQVAASDAREVELARDLAAELTPLQLRPGEETELEEELLTLRHAARITEAALGMADAAGADGSGAADLLAAALRPASELERVDLQMRPLTAEADELVARLRELALDARRHADDVSLDASRLITLEERMDVLARVARRHGSIDAAIAALARAQEVVAAADGADSLASLQGAVAEALVAAGGAATRLSHARRAAARRLEQQVTQELRRLEMPLARFRVVLSRTPDADGVDLGDGVAVRCGAHGVDDVEFRLSANRDTVPMPLDQGPSGGELARLALALSAVVAEEGAPALVLDEIDSGIGGETAARVGDVLALIGRSRQVVAVTHRAEIAARASTHLLVTKREAAGGATATVAGVERDERTVEIARLMSGRSTRAALARAAELLDDGRSASSPPAVMPSSSTETGH